MKENRDELIINLLSYKCPSCGDSYHKNYWHNNVINGYCPRCRIYYSTKEKQIFEYKDGSMLIPRSNMQEIKDGSFIPYNGQLVYNTDENHVYLWDEGEKRLIKFLFDGDYMVLLHPYLSREEMLEYGEKNA